MPDIAFYGLRTKLDFCNIRNRSHGRREGDSEATMKSIASWQQQSATAWMDNLQRICRFFAEIMSHSQISGRHGQAKQRRSQSKENDVSLHNTNK
jgi:hypothetical protein